MIVIVFSTEVLTGDAILIYVYWRQDRHFTWSSEPREGQAACSTKEYLHLSVFLKTLSCWSGPGNLTHDLPLSAD